MLGSPPFIYKPWKGHLEGEQPQLGDLMTMVINHLPTGMILQVLSFGIFQIPQTLQNIAPFRSHQLVYCIYFYILLHINVPNIGLSLVYFKSTSRQLSGYLLLMTKILHQSYMSLLVLRNPEPPHQHLFPFLG